MLVSSGRKEDRLEEVLAAARLQLSFHFCVGNGLPPWKHITFWSVHLHADCLALDLM